MGLLRNMIESMAVAGLIALTAACTAEDSRQTSLSDEKQLLQQELSITIADIDRRIEEILQEAPAGDENGHNGTDGDDGPDNQSGTAEEMSPVDRDIDRLRQIRSALAYRLDRIEHTSEARWPEFRADAERLVGDTREVFDEMEADSATP